MLIFFEFGFATIVGAQNGSSATAPPVDQKISIYGFVRNEAFYDTRENITARNGVVNFYPLDHSNPKDLKTTDTNATPSLGFSAVVTRLGVKFGGLTVLGAKATGILETDFLGIGNGLEASIRLRHAYAKLEWTHQNGSTSFLLIGQYWNPNFNPKNSPITVNFSSGIPVSHFGFIPQFRYTYTDKSGFGATGVLMGYESSAFAPAGKFPAGSGVSATQFSQLPSFALQGHFENKSLFFIAGVEGDPISPDKRDAVNGTAFLGLNFMASGKYTNTWLIAKAYGNYGDLTTQHLGLGGLFAYKDLATSQNRYVAPKQLALWADFTIQKSKTVQPGLFLGYQKNLGFTQGVDVKNTVDKSDQEKQPVVYGRAVNLTRSFDVFFRMAPRIDTYFGKLKLSLEYELTTMKWVNTDYSPDATNFRLQASSENPNAFDAINHRILFLFVYNF